MESATCTCGTSILLQKLVSWLELVSWCSNQYLVTVRPKVLVIISSILCMHTQIRQWYVAIGVYTYMCSTGTALHYRRGMPWGNWKIRPPQQSPGWWNNGVAGKAAPIWHRVFPLSCSRIIIQTIGTLTRFTWWSTPNRGNFKASTCSSHCDMSCAAGSPLGSMTQIGQGAGWSSLVEGLTLLVTHKQLLM